MKKKSVNSLKFPILFTSIIISCTAVVLISSFTNFENDKHIQRASKADMCEETIKFYSDTIQAANGEFTSMHTEIIIDPINKIINLSSSPPDQEKVSFDTSIQEVECNLDKKMLNGSARYKGYITQLDGTTTPQSILVQVKDGKIVFSNDDPQKEKEFFILINKWEIIQGN